VNLASAIQHEANYLVTFNTKHFHPDPAFKIVVCKPGELLQRIRDLLNEL
jgi:hypothetical protein